MSQLFFSGDTRFLIFSLKQSKCFPNPHPAPLVLGVQRQRHGMAGLSRLGGKDARGRLCPHPWSSPGAPHATFSMKPDLEDNVEALACRFSGEPGGKRP